MVGAKIVAALYEKLSLRILKSAVVSATFLSTMIMVIVASSTLFSQLVAFTGTSRALVSWATDLGYSQLAMFALMMLLPLVLCMFIDQVAFLLMAVPLYQPLVSSLGFDPIWFWTLFLINLTVGGVTPPFGYSLFALAGATPNISISKVYAASIPVVLIFILSMVLLTLMPQLQLWLPRLL